MTKKRTCNNCKRLDSHTKPCPNKTDEILMLARNPFGPPGTLIPKGMYAKLEEIAQKCDFFDPISG